MKKKTKDKLAPISIGVLGIVVAITVVALVGAKLVFFQSYAYTNQVQYQGVNYTINQYWSEPDSCLMWINYTKNGTALWKAGWNPTRPAIANATPFMNASQNNYEWRLSGKASAIYNQEWNTTNGIAWACCGTEFTCV